MKNYRQSLVAMMIGAASWVGAAPACATSSASGQIDTLYAAQGTNYGYRVYLSGVTTICPGGTIFAYTNVTDDNYKAYIATLLTAFALGKQVNLTLELVGGQCHIMEVFIRTS